MTGDQRKHRFPGRALVVGISAYPGGLELPLAVRSDAEDFASALTDPSVSGYDPAQVERLLDKSATAIAIRAGLARLKDECRIGDTVIIYFSGHGDRWPIPGLLAADVDPVTGRQSVISRDELSAALSVIVSDRVVVILDACHSGGAVALKSGAGPVGLATSDLERLFSGSGRAIIASSGENQPSAILPGERNSLFTKHLLAGLRGAAFGEGDIIRLLELYSFAASEVRKERPDQTPVLKADLTHDIPMALRPASSRSGPVTPSTATLWDVLADLYPLGPQDQHLWSRAGGDLSRIALTGMGRNDWYTALRTLTQGGGGAITQGALLSQALLDYPRHPALLAHYAATAA